MAFILDASVAVAWVVPSQSTDYAGRIRLKARREAYHVPMIFSVEVANVLVTLERRKILSAAGAAAAARVLERLDPVVHTIDAGIDELRTLARQHALSAYDALYLRLAIDTRHPVACGDRPLKLALEAAGLKLA